MKVILYFIINVGIDIKWRNIVCIHKFTMNIHLNMIILQKLFISNL